MPRIRKMKPRGVPSLRVKITPWYFPMARRIPSRKGEYEQAMQREADAEGIGSSELLDPPAGRGDQ